MDKHPATTRDNPDLHSTHGTADDIRAPRRVTKAATAENFAAVAGDADPELVDAKASETWRALRYRYPRYERWCEQAGRTPLPCSAEQLREYVRALMAERMAPATIAVYVSAVCAVARLRSSHADRRLIGEHMKAARRRHGPPKRARPVRNTDLDAVLDRCDPARIRDCRDALLFALSFGLAARSSELVGLDWERSGSTLLGSTGVATTTETSILVRWHRTKTAQEREVELEIPDEDMPLVRLWLERWLALAVVEPGTPLFRPLTRWATTMPARLSTAAVSDIIRRRWLELEVARGVSIDTARQRAARFSSHSLRRGFCTSAAEAGLPFDAIRKRSRHADDGVLAGYIGEAEGRRHSGLKGLFNRERGR